MPFYEYECSNCKFYSEVMQKITDPPLKKCPSCGKNTLQKLVSVPNFRLKGGGWYETDFKSEKENRRHLAEGEKSEAKEGEAKQGEAKEAKQGEAKEAKPAEAAGAKSAEGKPGETRAAEPKPGAEVLSTSARKSVAPSRKPVSHRTAKTRGTRPGGRSKARRVRKARR
jgi:putative FmdB family regulatory protein